MLYRDKSLLTALCGFLILGSAGCVSERIAVAFTDAPNGGRQEVETSEDHGPEVFDDHGQIDVPGPPAIRMAYWVMDPSAGQTERIAVEAAAEAQSPPAGWRVFDAEPKGEPGGQAFLRISRAPAPKEAATAQATVVVLQGWGTRVRSGDYLLHLNTALADAGCRVICPDLRGHGDSGGEYVTSGFREVQDLSALLDDFDRRGLLQGPVGVIGHSYGGGVAIQFAAHDRRVQRVLALSPLADIRPAMLPGIRAFLKEFRPVQWTLYLQWMIHQDAIDRAQALMEQRTGADLAVHNALHQIGRLGVPVLILQGDNDIATPLEGAEKLRAANPQWVDLKVFPGADHTSYLRDDYREVESRLRDWAEALKNSPSS